MAIYLRLKGQGRPDTFKRAAERSCGYLIDICGNKSITTHSRKDANKFRDALVSKGLAGSSITRVFGTVRSIINFAASEVGIDLNNPFAKVYFDRKAGVTERQPIPEEAIADIQAACRDQDDELRWLVSLVSDSGMRLAEATGLALDDIKLDSDTPHVIVREHPWRRLKTSSMDKRRISRQRDPWA
ncbi:site-specific integrase [Roseovarius sp. S4756]|uniref:site-specific integrase n=1 Tax=Roseovarius maritimus TaxID=3342637 RepID=UPI003728DCB0